MYCVKCGTPFNDSDTHCSKCNLNLKECKNIITNVKKEEFEHNKSYSMNEKKPIKSSSYNLEEYYKNENKKAYSMNREEN